ncbi:MAG: M24 family metallopeptidase [Desulfitobacteriia bacterium]
MRINKLRRVMLKNDLPTLIVTSRPNIYYLSGFTGSNATLFITEKENFLLTDFRYLEQAEKEAPAFKILKADREVGKKISELSSSLTRIGIEEEEVSWAQYKKWEKEFAGVRLVEASKLLGQLREIKDREEIEIIRQAVEITDRAFKQILNRIKLGVEEREISLELEFFLRREGASAASFEYIVASGFRGALPHGVASEKKIKNGELLTMDFGAKYQGYCSDLTRTVSIGKPTLKQKEVYNLVLEAQLAALEAIKPGLKGKEIDRVARDIISKAGYGEYFGHGLGHSVGLEIHESPFLNTREEKVLEPGMIVTVEPGIYIPGWGGVRIEDMVLVTNSGAEVLTQASKEFIIID